MGPDPNGQSAAKDIFSLGNFEGLTTPGNFPLSLYGFNRILT
jgi:hypothetical protein